MIYVLILGAVVFFIGFMSSKPIVPLTKKQLHEEAPL